MIYLFGNFPSQIYPAFAKQSTNVNINKKTNGFIIAKAICTFSGVDTFVKNFHLPLIALITA